jgi:hypothetical protein
MCRIFNSRGLVVIDYDKVEIQIEAHLAAARAAHCQCITIKLPKGQLLYLGNRPADAIAAKRDDDCRVFCTTPAKPRSRRSGRRKS